MSDKEEITRPLETLISDTREHLLTLNYCKSTLSKIESVWKKLLSFSKTEGVVLFTTEFGYHFLKEQYDIEIYGTLSSSKQRNIRRAITILSDFQLNGFIHRRQKTRLHQWIPEYKQVCEEFMNEIESKSLSSGSNRNYSVLLEKFTAYLSNNDVHSINEMTSENLDGFILSYAGYANSTTFNAFSILRTFLRFIQERGYTELDFSHFVPKVKLNKRANLPSLFTKEEIEKLLASVDRGNPQGKRDYAILLLAVRYGMRVGEIISLQLKNLDFKFKKIQYTQNKTGVNISVDMLENVGWALIDYLKNGRPNTKSTHVFVRCNAPYSAFQSTNNLGSIMDKYLTRAGIKRTSDRHYGMHAIRHSLASHLLEQGNPLHVISDVLGHLEMDSTMIYTKVDLNTLSLCALEVPNNE